MRATERIRAAAAYTRELISGEYLTCVCCRAELFSDDYFCKRCLESLPFNAGYVCEKCGRRIPEDYPVCMECKANMPEFDAARSVFVYEGETVGLIKKLKTGGKHVAEALAAYMLPLLARFASADFLAYVPMTPSAEKRRGYNQSRLLAEELSARSGIPVADGMLVKTRETSAQKDLNARERAKNLNGSFRVHERALCRGKKIVLVDDVLTSGATADAVARALLRAGAQKVYVLTAASVPMRAADGDGK